MPDHGAIPAALDWVGPQLKGIRKQRSAALTDLVAGPRIRLKPRIGEFETQLSHWLGSTGEGTAEVPSIFGRPGERIHVRARSRREESGG